jgi:hypothetical protein
MNDSLKIFPLLRGLCGAAVGGLIGYFVFGWIIQQGFYAMVLPGAVLGMGYGLASRARSAVGGIISGVLALAFGLFMEWKHFPFVKDDSFGYFISHVHQLKPITLIMIVLGAFIAFWFGVGRDSIRQSNTRDDSTEQD